jgi:hypothetical protein
VSASASTSEMRPKACLELPVDVVDMMGWPCDCTRYRIRASFCTRRKPANSSDAQ